MRRWLAIVIFAVAVATAPAAFAHASLVAADPVEGAVLSAAPTLIDLDFNEQVSPVTLTLVTPAGQSTGIADFRLEQTHVLAPLPAQLGNGTYAFSWRVISEDGHPVGGTLTFSIGAPSSDSVANVVSTGDWTVRAGIWTSRVLVYVGLFAGIGGIFFLRWFAPTLPGIPWLRALGLLGLAALATSVGFQGLDALGQPVGNLASAAVWQEGLASSYGIFVALAGTGFVLALLASLPVRFAPAFSLLAFVCVGAGLAATGHASAADPQWLTRSAVFLHTMIVGFWIGALLPLAFLLRGPADHAVVPLRRFSASIPPLLLLLVIAGTILAVIQVRSPEELLATDYGHVFIAKMAAVALLLALAAFNRWGLTGTVLADAAIARRHLALSIALELVLVCAIFGIVSLWRFTPPPRALLATLAPPSLMHVHTGEAMAEMSVSPGRPGPVDVSLSLMAADMTPLVPKQVDIAFSNAAKGIEPITRTATLGSDDDWHVESLPLPIVGTWQVEIDILISDFKELRLTGSIDLGG